MALDEGAPRSSATSRRQSPACQGRILVVDDEPLQIKLIGTLLEMDGHEVLFATNGRQALDLAARTRPDLILLDLVMPGIDGTEVCRELKRRPELAGIPVIFVSARVAGTDGKEASFEVGGLDRITKPFSGTLLRQRVRDVVADQLAPHRAAVTAGVVPEDTV